MSDFQMDYELVEVMLLHHCMAEKLEDCLKCRAIAALQRMRDALAKHEVQA